ncbi:MAG TPA: NAD(P)H-hydrate dehydratase [Patescibacteria group bacterium]
MKEFNESILKQVYLPESASHKGQNGKLLIIGGSSLFHAASLWALQIASKIVDMVFYASVPENNKLVHEAKQEFRNGIVVPREDVENYIEEADCILIGPGMVRTDAPISESKLALKSLKTLSSIKDEGAQTFLLTEYLLGKYPHKKWVIDAGSLQMLNPKWLLPLKGNAILTPHEKEFERTFNVKATEENVLNMATLYKTTIILKSHADIVCNATECVVVKGGNAGMTKGGTGDVLAGLTAALYCKNDSFVAAQAASFFNKKAGDALFEKVGYYFNSSELANEIPVIMKKYLL